MMEPHTSDTVPGNRGPHPSPRQPSRRFSWRPLTWCAALSLLLVPAIAMRFTEEVQWTKVDFGVFGAMLLFAGILIEGLLRLVPRRRMRTLGVTMVVLLFVLTWIELAVGIF